MGEEPWYLPTGILPGFLGLVTLPEVAELLFQPGHLHVNTCILLPTCTAFLQPSTNMAAAFETSSLLERSLACLTQSSVGLTVERLLLHLLAALSIVLLLPKLQQT